MVTIGIDIAAHRHSGVHSADILGGLPVPNTIVIIGGGIGGRGEAVAAHRSEAGDEALSAGHVSLAGRVWAGNNIKHIRWGAAIVVGVAVDWDRC